ncbi:MAG: hypothetical protein U1E88_05340 [Acinetobacter sp.]
MNLKRTEISRAEIYFKELESRVKYNLPMTDEEKAKYAELKDHVTKSRQEYENSRKYLSNIRLMTGVAEGLLQQAEAIMLVKPFENRKENVLTEQGQFLVNMEHTLN